MCEILIFGGTTEGRELAEFCRRRNIPACVSVATEYGASLLEGVRVVAGRMTETEMLRFIKENKIKLVIDATHPYAREATENISNACAKAKVRRLRVLREEKRAEDGRYFDTMSDIVSYLSEREGGVFITTGSKELDAFCSLENYKNRCAVRVLPTGAEMCIRLGFSKERIIAAAGPFTTEENVEQLKKFDARFLVTKDSGAVGGFYEKLAAAKETGAEALILKRPSEEGIPLSEAKRILAMYKKIFIVGVGMDGDKTLTKEAKEAIETSDELIGAKRLLELFADLHKPSFASYDSAEIARHIRESEYKNICISVSGDCGFFSGAKGLLENLRDFDVSVLPGISTPVYLASRLQIPWSGMCFVSLHGRDGAVALPVSSHEKTFFLLGGAFTAADLCRRLTHYGMGNLTVHAGENLSLENERIISAPAKELCALETGRLCAAIVENPGYTRYLRAGIPDEEFIRRSVPMTKSEVRCIAVSKMEVGENDIVWDVGAGTGSVSVETALRCERGRVYALERDKKAATLIDENRRKFFCDNIEIVPKDAADALFDLPKPDKVFIGGSGGRLEKIAEIIKEKNPSALIVATAVSLETLGGLREIFSDDSEITQISVTRTKKTASHTMLFAQNPVFIVRGHLK